MSLSSSRRPVAAVAAVLLVAPLLVGCFQNPLEAMVENVVQDAAEGALKEATGADVNLKGELPDGFPSGVPLPDATLVTAVSNTTDGETMFILAFSHDGTSRDAYDQARDTLLAAGFEENSTTDVGGKLISGDFSDSAYGVTVSAIGDDGDVQINYMVAPVSE